jgi:hypothetical protein
MKLNTPSEPWEVLDRNCGVTEKSHPSEQLETGEAYGTQGKDEFFQKKQVKYTTGY